jgi:hypothetical protein
MNVENRYKDFYEGTTHKKLKHILDAVIYTLRPYGDNFDVLVDVSIKITKNITWDKFESTDMYELFTVLEGLVHTLINIESEIKAPDFEKIKQVIEPLEIVITEIKMAYTID